MPCSVVPRAFSATIACTKACTWQSFRGPISAPLSKRTFSRSTALLIGMPSSLQASGVMVASRGTAVDSRKVSVLSWTCSFTTSKPLPRTPSGAGSVRSSCASMSSVPFCTAFLPPRRSSASRSAPASSAAAARRASSSSAAAACRRTAPRPRGPLDESAACVLLLAPQENAAAQTSKTSKSDAPFLPVTMTSGDGRPPQDALTASCITFRSAAGSGCPLALRRPSSSPICAAVSLQPEQSSAFAPSAHLSLNSFLTSASVGAVSASSLAFAISLANSRCSSSWARASSWCPPVQASSDG
mmetsp:Transcript_62307/g.163601  ORF Transcript_62307/g.163601 Transcript_62307/m.163601 type:complete len:300 (+) Transcript_62307:868-1767(+)